jgi:hypothetical protein
MTSSSFISKSRLGGFYHAPSSGLAYSCPGSPNMDYLGTLHETTWSGFVPGGIHPCLVLWRGTCLCWLSPTHDDPDSTQILTRYCGAKSQTVSQLTNTRVALTRQVPIVQPLRVIKTPTSGVRVHAACPSKYPDRSGGFISREHKSKQYIRNLASVRAFSSAVCSGATRWIPPRDFESRPWRL